MKKRNYLSQESLNKFTNSKQWHTFSTLTPEALISDGALFVAEEGDVLWLFDIIGLFQTINLEYNQEVFQHWMVKLSDDGNVTIECEDGNNNIIYSQVKPTTIFPIKALHLYAVNEEDKIKIMLPSEYK